MKIALCLHGISIGTNNKGQVVTYDKSFPLLNKNILNLNDVDIFIHTWNENEEEIKTTKKLYEPKDSIFEKQIIFADDVPRHISNSNYDLPGTTKWHTTKSRWYSYMKSVELKQKYERQNNFKYDFVFVTRFDNCFLTPFIFSEYDSNYFYASDDFDPEVGFNETFFFSNSEAMDNYSTLFNHINEYINQGCQFSSHVLSKYHAIQIGLEDKIRLTKKIIVDYQLERRI